MQEVDQQVLMPARRPWMLAGLYLAVCTALALHLSFGIRGIDPDYYWHLRTGELMLLNHTSFSSDIYSWTFQDKPWLDHEWLAQLMYALVDRLGGLTLVRLLHGLVVLAYLAILRQMLRLGGVHWAAALGLSLVAGLGTYAIFLPRPQTVSVLGVAIFALVIYRSQQLPETSANVRWLPILIIPWANCHAGFMMGVAWLLLAALGERLQSWRPLSPGEPVSPRELLILAASGVVAGLATPHGPALYTLAFRSLFDRDLRWMNAAVGEWRPPGWYETPHLLLLLFAGLVVVMVLQSRHRARWTPLLWGIVACTAATQSIRHLPFAWIALTVLAAQHLPDGFQQCLRASRKATYVVLGVWCALITILAGLEVAGSWAPAYPSNQVLARLQQLPPRQHLFNAYDWGGIFIYYLYPRQRVYIDGRLWTLYSARHLQDYYTIAETRPGWQQLLARQGIDLIAVPPDAPIATAAALLPGWQVLFRDHTAVILSHKTPPTQLKGSRPGARTPGAP